MLASTGAVLIISALILREGSSFTGEPIRACDAGSSGAPVIVTWLTPKSKIMLCGWCSRRGRSVGQEIEKEVSSNLKRGGLANQCEC